VSLSAGDYPLHSASDLAPSIVFTGANNVVLEGADDGIDAACTPPNDKSTR
jgi:hypothetical protein